MHCQKPYGVKESRFRRCKLLVTLTDVLISKVPVVWAVRCSNHQFWNNNIDSIGVTLGLYRYYRTVSLLTEIYRKKEYDVGETAGISHGSGTTAITTGKEQKCVVIICWQRPKLYIKGFCTVQIRFISLKSSVVVNKPVPKMDTHSFLPWKSNIASHSSIGAHCNVEDAFLSGMPSSYPKKVIPYEWVRSSLLSLPFVSIMKGLILPYCWCSRNKTYLFFRIARQKNKLKLLLTLLTLKRPNSKRTVFLQEPSASRRLSLGFCRWFGFQTTLYPCMVVSAVLTVLRAGPQRCSSRSAAQSLRVAPLRRLLGGQQLEKFLGSFQVAQLSPHTHTGEITYWYF